MAKSGSAVMYASAASRNRADELYQHTREQIESALANPATSARERAELSGMLRELTADYTDNDHTHVSGSGVRAASRDTRADRVYDEFSQRAHGINDELLLGYGHLLGGAGGGGAGRGGSSGAGGVGGNTVRSDARADLGAISDDPAAMVRLMERDPQAFAEHYRGLDPEDRQLLTMQLQHETQQTNQLFNLLSNLQQAQHQTARAIAANLRV